MASFHETLGQLFGRRNQTIRDSFLYARPESGQEAPFEVVLNWSTQKPILAQQLAERISGLKNGSELSILDIGSSKGTLIGMLAGQLTARGFDKRIRFSLLEPDASSVQSLVPYAESIADHSAGKFTSHIIQAGWEEFTPEEKYDGIICSHVIYHFEPNRLQDLFMKMIGSLKESGRLFVSARENEGNEVFAFIQKYKLMATGETFNEITIDDAIPVLERIVGADSSLVMEQKSLHGAVGLPFVSYPDAAKTIVAFFLQRPSWDALPASIQQSILADFDGKDGYLAQVDRLIEIFRKG